MVWYTGQWFMQAPQRMQRSISCMSAADEIGATGVDQDEVHVLRAVTVALAARPGEQRT